MRLIRLTSLPHPDFDGGQSHPVYLDADSVLVIERGQTSLLKFKSGENNRQALQSMWQEVDRVASELNNMPKHMVPDNEKEVAAMNRWLLAKTAADSLSVAYGLVVRARPDEYHPVMACTVVSLACGTALEHGVMLSRVFVTEFPDEVYRAVGGN